MKKEIALTGKVIRPLTIGQSTTVVAGDKVTFTTEISAVHSITKKNVVFETRNTIYNITLVQEKANLLRSIIAFITGKTLQKGNFAN